MDVSATPPRPAVASETGLTDHRALALVTAAGLLLPVQTVASAIVHAPLVGLLGAALTVVALLLVCAYATTTSRARLEQLDWWLLATGIAVIVLAVAGTSRTVSIYFSDEAALVHAAAVALLHGHDPYAANLQSALARYGVTGNLNLTYLMNGGTAHTLNYPAVPVLAALPNVALAQNSAAVVFALGTAAAVATATMFLLLPKALRPLAVLVGADFPIVIAFSSVGLNIVMLLAPLTVCAFRWGAVGTLREDGRGSLGRLRILRAVCLGLALATNQLAWFVTPFLLAGTFLSARQRLGTAPARRIVATYALIAGSLFLLINAPFIFWGPGQWLTGVMAPILQHAIPLGQGLVGVSVFARIGGGALSFYTYGSALLYLALMCVFWLRFERVSRCMMVMPLIALYTSGRSLDSYWLTPIGVVLVSMLCSGTADYRVPQASIAGSTLPPRRRILAGARWAALFLPAIACLGVALGTPGPLKLRIIGSRWNRSAHLDQLRIIAVNSSSTTLRPRFTLDTTGSLSGFWREVRGAKRLRPGETTEYVLDAPFRAAEPGGGARFIVQALTDTPQTMSSSSRITAVRP